MAAASFVTSADTHIRAAIAGADGTVHNIRHFLYPSPYPLDGSVLEADCDLLAELWASNKAELAPVVRSIVGAREGWGPEAASLFDDARSALATVEEYESALPWMASADRKPQAEPRSVVLLKRKPGMTLDEFITYYENRHAPLGVKHVPVFSRYRRLFLRPFGKAIAGLTTLPAYDVVTEVSYPDEVAQARAAELLADAETNAIIEADESNFIDKPSRRFMTVDQRED